jgi:hypothetical protein
VVQPPVRHAERAAEHARLALTVLVPSNTAPVAGHVTSHSQSRSPWS